MTDGSDRGWWEGNTFVKQNKLEPLGQSGHFLVPCHLKRSGCGLLFPKKSCHTLLAVTTAKVIYLVPAHALVSCPCHLVTFSLFIHSHFHTFIHSLSLHLSPVLIHPHVTLIQSLLLSTLLRICIKSPSLSAEALDYRLCLSFCPSRDGFEVLLWNVWVGKKEFFLCRKMVTYHFSVLVLSLSGWICSQQCHRVSLEMIFIESRGLDGATLRAQPRGLTLSLPLSPLQFPPQLLSQFI